MITLLQNISTQEYVSLNYQNSELAANTLEFIGPNVLNI